MIEVEQLSKLYGTSPAIQDVSFTVKKGEILGFLGPNGAGKTTTMRILTGYLPATSGTARVAGFDVHDDSMAVRQRIGYLPETPPLYPEMTVEGFLHFVARIKGVAAGDRTERVKIAMTRCNLLEKRKILIRKLSKGFRQRVGIAQAIVHDPPVIILDEPTVGLDPRQIIDVRNLIKSLAGDHTIILSTHILPEVKMTCDRITIINRGQVVATNSPSELVSQLQGSTQYELDVAGPVEAAIPQIEQLDFVETVHLKREVTDPIEDEDTTVPTTSLESEPETESEPEKSDEDPISTVAATESMVESNDSVDQDTDSGTDSSDESSEQTTDSGADSSDEFPEQATDSVTDHDESADQETEPVAESDGEDDGDRSEDNTEASGSEDQETQDPIEADLTETSGQESSEEEGNGRLSLMVHFHPGAEGGPELAKTIIQAGLELYEMRRSQASLEDVFLNLTMADPSLNPLSQPQGESSISAATTSATTPDTMNQPKSTAVIEDDPSPQTDETTDSQPQEEN